MASGSEIKKFSKAIIVEIEDLIPLWDALIRMQRDRRLKKVRILLLWTKGLLEYHQNIFVREGKALDKIQVDHVLDTQDIYHDVRLLKKFDSKIMKLALEILKILERDEEAVEWFEKQDEFNDVRKITIQCLKRLTHMMVLINEVEKELNEHVEGLRIKEIIRWFVPNKKRRGKIKRGIEAREIELNTGFENRISYMIEHYFPYLK